MAEFNVLEDNVLACLCENARYTNEEIARITGATIDEVNLVINKMEGEGTILKYTAVVNKPNTDTVNALIEVKVVPEKMHGFDALAEEISSFSEVKNLYLMSGGFDLAVFVEGKNLLDISNFISNKLSQVEGIVSVATHFVLKKYKIEGASSFEHENEREFIL